jgi:putative SOS response-associated peptidase YedK
MAEIHNRMPAILDRPSMWEWLDPLASPIALRALLVPYAGAMKAYPVSTLVNKPQNDSPECVRPEKA